MNCIVTYNNLLQMDKLTSITLKAVPDECRKEILRVQAEERVKHKKQFSLESAVYKIIKSTIKKDG